MDKEYRCGAGQNAMNMEQLAKQYQEQLNIVKRQIKDMEKADIDAIDRSKYKQLKQMKAELQANIRQIIKYVKKG